LQRRRAISRAPRSQQPKAIERAVTPWELDFLVRQRKTWVGKGGELIALPGARRWN